MFEDFGGVEILAKVDVEDAESGWFGEGEKLVDGGAGGFVSLREGTEADGVCLRYGAAGVFVGGDFIPGDVLVDDVLGLAVGGEFDGDGAGGSVRIDLDTFSGEVELLEAIDDVGAVLIGADAGDDEAGAAQGVRVIGEICGSAAELATGGEEVPEDFAEADEGEHGRII